MNKQTFSKGMEALMATFPGLVFNSKLYWEMLSELEDVFFLKAVWNFIKTTKEIFPGTNIIATLRESAQNFELDYRKEHVLKIEAESERKRIERWKREAVPMPDYLKSTIEQFAKP